MNLQTFLKNEYDSRKIRNTQYSIRAFSRDLGLSPAFLVQLLNGSKRISIDKAAKIAENLSFNEERFNLLINIVQISHISDEETKHLLEEKLKRKLSTEPNFQEISEIQFRLVSKWYMSAVIELVDLKNGKINAEIIADLLSLKIRDAQEILDDLVKIGILEKSKGFYSKTNHYFRISEVPSRYIKKYHRSMISKAERSLDTQKFDQRDITGCTLSFNKQNINEVKELIKDFRQKILKFSEQSNCNSIYQLNVQFFELLEKPI